MEQYTETMEDKALFPDEDNYEKALEDAANTFRNFDKALDYFLVENGYQGDADDCKAKIKYIQSKFESTSVDPIETRTLKKWFSVKENNKTYQNKDYFSPLDPKTRKLLFRFCFAFQLSIEENDAFFRKVCLQRSFDCHDIYEVIYYYALSHQLSYQETKGLIDKTLKGKEKIGKGSINSDNKLYTKTIKECIDRFENADELVQYLRDNYSQFEYNNVTAYERINTIWNRISETKGLANQERVKCIYNNEDTDNPSHHSKDIWEKRSDWEIYLQILGLDETLNKGSISIQKNSDKRNIIHSILNDNKLIHPLAADSFPDRQGLEAILKGKHKSDELVRKTLIFLDFYKFWVKKALEPLGNKDDHYQASQDDTERWNSEVNKYLTDAGYPELYFGNPFDWIFLCSANQVAPLRTFREFMHESYCIKEDELIPKE